MVSTGNCQHILTPLQDFSCRVKLILVQVALIYKELTPKLEFPFINSDN